MQVKTGEIQIHTKLYDKISVSNGNKKMDYFNKWIEEN